MRGGGEGRRVGGEEQASATLAGSSERAVRRRMKQGCEKWSRAERRERKLWGQGQHARPQARGYVQGGL